MKLHKLIFLFLSVFILQQSIAQKNYNNGIPIAELKKYLGIPSMDSLLHQTDEDAQRLLIIQLDMLKPGTPDLPSIRSRLLLLSQKIIDFAKANGNKKLELQFELFVYINNLQQFSNKKLSLTTIEKINQKAKDENIKWAIIISKYYLAKNYFDVQEDFSKGFILFRQTLNDIKDDPTNDYLVKDLLHYYLQIGYYLMGDYRTALIYGHNNLIPKIEKYDVLPYITNMNTVGIIYRNLNQLDSSNYYFMQILQMATQKKDSVWIALSNGNLAENFYLQKNYDAALPLLKLDAEYAFFASDFGPASNAYLLMTTIYLRKGDIENAENYLKKGTECVYKYRYPNSIDKYRRFKLLYETLTQYYISKNNAQLAQNYFDSSKIFSDSILYIRTNMTSVKTEGIFNLQQSEIQKLKLTNDLFASQKKQYLIWGILIIVLLSGAFGFSQYHNKAKLKEALLQLEKEKVEVDLTAARAELENYILKFATLSQPDENEAGWKEITILTQEHWQKFQELFHNSYPDFTQRAYEKIPSLTETELRFLCLLKVKLNDTEMGNVLGVNKNTIQQTRSRLRKKLNLDGNVSFSDLVEEI